MDLYDIAVARKLSGGGGGGGSSDFSTATITVDGDGMDNININCACAVDDGDSSSSDTYNALASGDSANIILYKGKAGASITSGGGTFTISGDIQHTRYDAYIITGDCTITISPK